MRKITNPRELAVISLTELEKTGTFLNEIVDFYLTQNNLSVLDRGLFTELVYGTTRMYHNLNYILESFSKRPLRKIKPVILNNLRLGVYQLLYLDKIPPSAAVNEAVKLARLFGHEGEVKFTNGILRQVARNLSKIDYPSLQSDPLLHVSTKYSFPIWIIELWLERWGIEETIKLCRAMNEPPEMHIRVNTLKYDRQEVADYLEKQGIKVEQGRYLPEILRVSPASQVLESSGLRDGMFYIQDESSALVAHALNIEPGNSIYDLCSAPGGKTTHMAQLMDNRGKIVAFDLSLERLKLVDENAQRLGITIIETRRGDATVDLNLPRAQRVLVDAPCSGLGTMRHRPDIRIKKSLEEVKQLVSIQKKILSTAANYVACGGLLVYSTCTINKLENEDIVDWFLENNHLFESSPLPEWFPNGELPGQRTILPHLHSLDGFFIASFKKVNFAN
ncbi:MAG: 16S rRNA (cytosine(967)-C(5))-methyltransferase RsmB [Bacillota bacterium]|nr:16S rRNA (cytosine(967)-C(5))-methyltransferase RsmB [Bacillota bacterium]